MVASAVVQSVTNREIARYWRQRQMLEEDHLYAALKAAARLRARNLTDEDYLQFEDSLKEDDENEENDDCPKVLREKYKDKERRVGIRDWWTKSKYAYLNQPAMKLVDHPRRRSYSHHPQFLGCKSSSPLNSKQWMSQAA